MNFCSEYFFLQNKNKPAHYHKMMSVNSSNDEVLSPQMTGQHNKNPFYEDYEKNIDAKLAMIEQSFGVSDMVSIPQDQERVSSPHLRKTVSSDVYDMLKEVRIFLLASKKHKKFLLNQFALFSSKKQLKSVHAEVAASHGNVGADEKDAPTAAATQPAVVAPQEPVQHVSSAPTITQQQAQAQAVANAAVAAVKGILKNQPVAKPKAKSLTFADKTQGTPVLKKQPRTISPAVATITATPVAKKSSAAADENEQPSVNNANNENNNIAVATPNGKSEKQATSTPSTPGTPNGKPSTPSKLTSSSTTFEEAKLEAEALKRELHARKKQHDADLKVYSQQRKQMKTKNRELELQVAQLKAELLQQQNKHNEFVNSVREEKAEAHLTQCELIDLSKKMKKAHVKVVNGERKQQQENRALDKVQFWSAVTKESSKRYSDLMGEAKRVLNNLVEDSENASSTQFVKTFLEMLVDNGEQHIALNEISEKYVKHMHKKEQLHFEALREQEQQKAIAAATSSKKTKVSSKQQALLQQQKQQQKPATKYNTFAF